MFKDRNGISSVFASVLASVFFLISQVLAGTVTYEYDDLNRLILVTYDNGTSIEYIYDEVGNREEKIITATILDSDGDGIPDDGDGSGDPTDNPCIGGNTVDCDDNCPTTHNPAQEDFDEDFVGDICDNCREVENTDQRDSNYPEDDNTVVPGMQHYGDICDPDYDNNGLVKLSDFSVWRMWYRNTVPPAPEYVDHNGDGLIKLSDFSIWNKYFRSPPGPGVGD
jgi:YD repeat-containing protein